MKKITLLIAFMLSLVTMGYGQTVLIDPAGAGGFASGTTFAANGWTVSNSANNPWVVGTAAASGALTGNAAYISNSGTFGYNVDASAGNYFYRDVTIPAGEAKITLTFNWYGQGESTWDLWQVYAAPTTITPVGTTTHPGSGATNVPAEIAGATLIGNGNQQSTVQTATYNLPAALAGTTFRLIFYWKNDGSGGTAPPAAIDNISLTSSLPTNYVSIATGNFGDASTWNLNSVPTVGDNITIAAGHTVTVNATGQSVINATVNGILAYGTTPTTFGVAGNLTVNATGAVNVLNGTTGKTLTVAGDIVNNGSINLSVGATTAGNLTLNGSTVQTLSGTGTFVNNMIRNLTFSNTSTAIPNINWQMNNINVEYNLNITNAKINLGTNTFTYGSSATLAGNTFTVTNGGFMPGGKFVRWWTAAGTGYTTSGPTSVATGDAGRYPFILSNGQQRLFYLGRTTPTAGGKFSVVFNDAATFTTGLSIADGTYTITDRWNGNFVVGTEGTSPAAASYWTTIFAPDLVYPSTASSRVMGQSAAISGTHVNTTPFILIAQRSGVSFADLTAPTGLYIGIANADVSHTAIANGDWNNPATWSKGTVPGCNDGVVILSGRTVTVNSAANVAKAVLVNSGGILNVASGDLTVGCTLKNNTFTNNGTLTVSGGTLNVNGSMLHASGSTFNQSGGDINVDGNDAGAAATSVAANTAIVQVSTNLINWTGGTLTIVDPHASTTATNTFQYSGTNVNLTSGTHTLRFGNGTSTDAGGSSTYGFRYYIFQGSGRLTFNNIVVNGGAGTNRFVTNQSTHGINGDLTINANSEYRDNANTVHFAKNLINNGTFVSTGTLYAGTYIDGTTGVSTNAQAISGTGAFVNNGTPASVTANFNSVTINNSNSAGVTFKGYSNVATQPANSISVSGTLTFTSGKAATSGGASFVLGNSTPSTGTLTYTAGGFVSGTTFGRWYTATGTGTSITAAADATGTGGRYPFVNSLNQDRSASIERNTPAAAAGVLAVTYTAGAGTTPISATDGAATVDLKGNDAWSVSTLSGTPTAATSFELQLLAPGLYTAPLPAANARIIAGTAFAGTHQAGTVTPGGQRVLTAAELVGGPFSLAIPSTAVPYVSIASGDWNSPATWQNGVVPGCNDIVNIVSGHTVTINSAANVAKGVVIAAGGILNIASGDLTVGCTLNNNTLTNNGTLNVTGGTLTVNGNINVPLTTSVFSQTGGTIKIDGNGAGVVANSVATSTPLFNIATTNISLTGGTLLFVDPHVGTTNSTAYTLSFTNSTPAAASLATNPAHITQFGDGVSTDAGGNTSGFYVSTWTSSAYLSFGSVVINGGSGTNRGVNFQYQLTTNGNLTINAGNTFTAATVIVGGNLNVAGTFISTTGVVTGVVASNTTSALTFGPAILAQTFTNTGTVSNLATSPTANFTALTVNNTNAAGLTFASPFSVSGTLTLTAGKVNTTNTNILTLGTATAAGTLSGGGATSYIAGPFARTIASGNANTNYIPFPVGKAAYTPVFLAPLTTAVTVMKAEAFDANTGTADPSIINLTANRRWEAPIVSGTVTDIRVRLADPNLTAPMIPVMAPSADGVYTNTFGSIATFVAGTPNTVQSITPVVAANYTGFMSFAESNVCFGTPVPGNTVASSATVCLGTPVTLSVQNTPVGTGVTYQWQSSVDGISFTDIASATNATYVAIPVSVLYYRVNVTCTASAAMGTTNPIQMNFATAGPSSTTPATRCGVGSVTLGATAAVGTLRWYENATGGLPLASGTSFTTNLTATKTFYVAAEKPGSATAGGGKVAPAAGTTSGTTPFEYGLIFNATSTFILNSVDVYLLSPDGGDLIVALKDNAGNQLQTTTIAAPAGSATVPLKYTINLGWSIPAGTGYRLVAMSGPSMIRETSAVTYPYAVGGVASITNGYNAGTSTNYFYFYNWNYTAPCASLRTAVTATVNTPPVLTLSGNPAAVCAGQTTAPVTITAGAADYNTYAWTPSTGVSGDAATGWTFNPAVSTAYTLQASQSTGSLCLAPPVTVNVTINVMPTAIVIPASIAVCEGAPQALTATGGLLRTPVGQENFDTLTAQFVTSNTAGTATTALNSTYFTQGTGSVLFNTSSNSANVSYSSAGNIDLSGSATAQLTFSHIAALEGPTFSYDIGYVEYSTNGGTTWTTFPASSYAGAGTLITTQGTSTPVSGVIFSTKSYADWTSTFTSATVTPTNALWKNETINIPVAALTNQFRVRFRLTTDSSALYYGWLLDNLRITGENSNVIWSPDTELFSDAAGTVPYAGQSLATVYVKPTAARTYTLTSTNGNTGCLVTASTDVTLNVVAGPTVPAPTQVICGTGTIADLVATGTDVKWYANAIGGTALDAATVVVDGTPYYASQLLDGCESYNRTVLTVSLNVVAAPDAEATQTLCEGTTVADLLPNDASVKWYAAATGGTPLASTDVLTTATSYFVSQTIEGCEGLARTEVVVTLSVTPAPTGDEEQEFCVSGTVADLIIDGDTITWYDAETAGNVVNGDVALVDGTVYYASQTIDGCEGLARFGVTATIHNVVADAPENVSFCSEYVLPELTIGAYFTEAGGTGVEVAAGTAITETTTLYVYAEEGTDLVCSDENSFTLTLVIVDTPTGDSFQILEVGTADEATIEDLVTDPVAGTITWYTTLANAQSQTNPLAPGTQLVQGATYYATQTVGECTSTGALAVAVNIVLDRNKFDVKAFTYHPNPVKDVLNLAYSSDITSVTVFNMLGQRVFTHQYNATDVKLDMSSLADGAYVVSVTSGSAVKTIKVIKRQ
ncbi:Ig-like domain-containing protein [Flavobacterium hauense]